jgi:DNA-binding MarR family transcriptional regulator/N-acetylglutamate synthase-like GNAT family acetyltransferase
MFDFRNEWAGARISDGHPMEKRLEGRIAGVRKFNRFYTRQIGLLRQGMVGTPYSLSEARVLYELGQGETKAAALAERLDIDPGFLSRMLRRLGARGLVVQTPSAADRRQSILELTAKGRTDFAALDRRSQQETATLLARLTETDQRHLVAAMAAIEALLGAPAASPRAVVLRPFRGGDMGWVLARHGALYGEERGWGRAFERLVAEIIVEFLNSFDPTREACWIAETDGEPVGTVMLVNAGGGVAKLRLLLVEPRARGLGIGRRLVEECIRFARQAGYRKITLWTQSILTPARATYERCGFTKVAEAAHCSFGIDLIGETWELEL